MRERSAKLATAALLAAATLPVPRAWAQDPCADAPPYVKQVAPETWLRPILEGLLGWKPLPPAPARRPEPGAPGILD